MRKIRHSWHFPLGLTLLAVLAGVGRAAPADPVEDLKQILRSEDMRPVPPQILAHRKEALNKIIERLQTPGELRRALAITEWKDDPLTKDPALLQIEMAARNEIGARFKAALERVAEHGDSTSRLAVANVIAELGPNVRSLRLKPKEDPTDPAVRGGFTRTLAPLVMKLARDARDDKAKRSLAVRQEALRALGGINADPKLVVPVLQEALGDAEVGPRRIAADALVQMVKIAGHLQKRTPSETGVYVNRKEVIETASFVLAASRTGLKDPDVQVVTLLLDATREAATALGDVRPPEPPERTRKLPPSGRPLTKAEKDYVDLYHKIVLDELRVMAPLVDELNKQALSILELIQRLNDAAGAGPAADNSLKLAAVDALEHIAYSRLRMIRVLEAVPQESGPKRELEGLDPLKDFLAERRNIITLTHLLRDHSAPVRRRTVEFLEMVQDKAAPSIPALIAHLNDPDRFVRWAAARALRYVAPAESAGAALGLGRLLEDPDLNVRRAAAGTLEVFGANATLAPALKLAVPYAARAVLGSNSDVRLAVIYALHSFGPEVARDAAPALAEALNPDVSSDPRVRAAAAEVLGKLGPRIFIDPQTKQVDTALFNLVIAALRRSIGDDDANVRASASDALLSLIPPPK
jgi:HEAT repeat protein